MHLVFECVGWSVEGPSEFGCHFTMHEVLALMVTIALSRYNNERSKMDGFCSFSPSPGSSRNGVISSERE